VLFTLGLCWRNRTDPVAFISCAVFGLSMIQLYTVSGIYHIGSWSGATYQRLNALDHANIFLLIAGTYTPLCAVLLSGWLRAALLTTIWCLAGFGVVFSGRTAAAPLWVMPALCVGMGMVAVPALPGFMNILPPPGIAALLLGGALYITGAVVFAVRWPDPLPRVFGFHEVFHLFTIAAAAAFGVVVWIFIQP
jgi:hemolysin III